MSAPHSPGAFSRASDSRSANSRYQGAFGMGRFGEGGVVARTSAVGGGVLYDGAELLAGEFICIVVVDHQFDAEWLAAGDQYVERLGEDVTIDEKLVASLLDRFARAERETFFSIASAAAVPSSNSEQLPISMPVSEMTAVWKFSSALEASLRNLG